jgi:hypothetical protein
MASLTGAYCGFSNRGLATILTRIKLTPQRAGGAAPELIMNRRSSEMRQVLLSKLDHGRWEDIFEKGAFVPADIRALWLEKLTREIDEVPCTGHWSGLGYAPRPSLSASSALNINLKRFQALAYHQGHRPYHLLSKERNTRRRISRWMCQSM